jgi:hypothetical protein
VSCFLTGEDRKDLQRQVAQSVVEARVSVLGGFGCT